MAGGIISTAQIFGLTIRESANDGSDFTNPGADYRRFFLGESGCLYVRDSSGAITQVGVGAGTAFPASPNTNLRFFRTDLGLEFYYDGTRWLTAQLFSVQPIPYIAGADPGVTGDLRSVMNATTSSGGGRIPVPSLQGGSNLWLVSYQVVFEVGGGGSALSGSHKWVNTLVGIDTNIASTGTAATTNVDSGSSSVFRTATTTIGAAMAAGTLWYASTWTKTGTPGTMQTGEVLSYRIIAT